jgi:hypothetical protein
MFNAWGMNLEKRLLLSTADLNANTIWLVCFYCVEETREPGEKLTTCYKSLTNFMS